MPFGLQYNLGRNHVQFHLEAVYLESAGLKPSQGMAQNNGAKNKDSF